MNTERPLHQPTPYQSERFVLLLGIILIASTLRTPMTSVGPLLPFIQEGLGLSNAVAGSITTIPLLAFALLSPFAPRIAERVGAERLVFAALLFIAIGIGVRYFMYVPALFIGTVFIGAGIAVGNVLLPGIVKKNFPLHIGLVTGLYGISMNIVAAIGSGVSEPIARAGLNWNGSLAIWGFVVFFALVVWGVQLSKNKNQTDRFCHPLKPHYGGLVSLGA
ncbi:MFS transporter [Geomicrobium sp. JCM 19039]|uniref:MFS transporter n=1 Tax=Geomicrobium sp. JCM 19039 TaxID=1460636 RepID=UPI0006947D64|nr:MFS transporter [Geomicrobium sp. JCM 19039]